MFVCFVNQNAKATRTQTKQTKSVSAQLRSSVEETEQRLSEQEDSVTQMLSQTQTEEVEQTTVTIQTSEIYPMYQLVVLWLLYS